MISDADDTQMLRCSKVVRTVNMKGVMKAALAHWHVPLRLCHRDTDLHQLKALKSSFKLFKFSCGFFN